MLGIVSPLALRQLSSLHGVHWSRLSDIGHTYGAASALLTGLALVGVVGSIIFQVRAIQVSREQAIREQHIHLVEMALADPIYQRAWGGLYDKYDNNSDRYRQHGYINLIVSFWQNHYMLGGFPENVMRNTFAHLFRGEAGRDFWADTRDIRLQESGGRRDRRFCQIMDEEYRKAIAAGPPVIKAEASPLKSLASQQVMVRDTAVKNGLILLIGAAGGIAFKSLLRRQGRLAFLI